ncbi:MAG: nicotinate (nicotinamide) nucleotide adenylyltransferase [Verrucomicrobia bacterium]|nr:nicotinate (nicotinamide) nucleotide adenylyltransferase [Verrucomicrobiota bacterium]
MADSSMKRVGIFGGTFDPVHIGHVAMMWALTEAHQLDHVYIIPASINPHKESTAASALHRLEMVKEAFKEVPRCSIVTLEIEKPGPSYTIDTVRELQQRGVLKSSDAHFLLIGQDTVEQLSTWKELHELIAFASPIIAARAGCPLTGAWQHDPQLKVAIEHGLTKTALMDVSSTDIRHRLRSGLFCGHLLQRAVLTYIQKHQLYL